MVAGVAWPSPAVPGGGAERASCGGQRRAWPVSPRTPEELRQKRDGGGRPETGSGMVGSLECVAAVKLPRVTSGCAEGTGLVTQPLTLSHCASERVRVKTNPTDQI